MAPEELRDVLRHQPFEPFRLVMTDGEAYEIRHPDLALPSTRKLLPVWVSITSMHLSATYNITAPYR